MTEQDPQAASATRVIAAALALFAEHGYEATSVEQIAKAAGVSRSTFFRQFGGKDDVIFADHERILVILREFLEQQHDNPWAAVCEGAMIVFKHFNAHPDTARRRYELVRQVPALREREIVAVFRYERLFDEYLRTQVPHLNPVDAVGFAALIAAVHNHVLRQMLRGKKVSSSVLRGHLDDAMRRYGVASEPAEPQHDDLVVAVFPRTMPAAEIARRIGSQLD